MGEQPVDLTVSDLLRRQARERGGKLAYRLTRQLELYLYGSNLLHHLHQESNNGAAQLPERSILLGTRVTF